jgi:hypothetical protein
MPVGRLGAIEEYPVALVRGARLQPSEPASLRQTEHLSQHVAEDIRARNRDKLDCSRVGDRQRKRKLPARSGKVTRCLLGLGPMLRRSRKIISQGLPQFQRSAFSASSRLFDLNGEANTVRKKQSSAIIAADVRRFGHVINKDEVFGTHSRRIRSFYFFRASPYG